MIRWLTEQRFNQKWEQKHKPNKEFMTPAFALNFNYNEIDSFADSEVSISEIDGIGTGLYWAGEIDGTLFSIEAVENNFECITVYLAKTEKITKGWEFIEIAEELFGNCIPNIIWVFGEDGGEFSLFYKNTGVTNCLYHTSSKQKAESLERYLILNGSKLLMSVALTDHHFNNWSAYCKGETGCYYSNRTVTEGYANKSKPLSEWKIVSCASTEVMKWALWRQDDNGVKFHIKDFEYEVDANFKALEFEAKGHRQIYWVEKIQ